MGKAKPKRITIEEIKTINTTIGANVLFFRNERGLSQDDLESLSGIAKSNISRIENRIYKWQINAAYITALATALKVEPDAITETNEEVKRKLQTLSLAVHKWPIADKTIQEVDALLEKTKNRGPRERAQAYMSRGHIEYALWHISRSLDFYEEGLSLALQSNDPLLITKARYNLALSLTANGRYERSEILISQALSENQSPEGEARLLQAKGSLYIKMGAFEKAVECYRKTLSRLDEIQNRFDVESRCFQNLGMAYAKLRMFVEAEENARKALDTADEAKHSLSLIYGLKVMSEILWEKGEKDLAISYLERALSIAIADGRKYERLLIDFHLAFKIKDFGRMKSSMDGLVVAEAPKSELIELFERAAELAQEVGQKDEAIFHLLKANELLKNR